MSPTPLYTTPVGFNRLKERIAAARRAYLEVCSTNEEAAGAGDSSVWHDSFAYEENQRQMHQLSARVADLERSAAAIRVVPAAAEAPDRVRVGCRVTLLFLDDDSERTLYVAGWDDGDPAAGRISYTAPPRHASAHLLKGSRGASIRRTEVLFNRR